MPKCKSEYREGSIQNNDDWVLLKNVDERTEINILEPVLTSADIPILKNHKGAGEYLKIYMGMTSFGIDVYVPKSKYDNALKILQDLKLDNKDILIDEENKNNNNKYKRKQILNVWLILLFFLAPGLIFYLFKILNKIYAILK